jgi:hypothetical protein
MKCRRVGSSVLANREAMDSSEKRDDGRGEKAQPARNSRGDLESVALAVICCDTLPCLCESTVDLLFWELRRPLKGITNREDTRGRARHRLPQCDAYRNAKQSEECNRDDNEEPVHTCRLSVAESSSRRLASEAYTTGMQGKYVQPAGVLLRLTGRAVLFVSLLWPLACARDSPPLEVPTRYGLEIGSRHRVLLGKAVLIAQSILQSKNLVGLKVWDNRSTGYPVFLVRGDGLGTDEYVFVPEGERCVFVNDDRVDAALLLFTGNGAGDLAVPAEDALALMLLHEAGHLAAGDTSSYREPVSSTVEELTDTLNVSKNHELRADVFAVDALRAAGTPGQPMKPFMAASDLEIMLAKISWNLATRRLLDDFAANALRERRLFLDHGYSHPNFELRFLIMNYRLQPTATAKSLLSDFIEGRQQRSPTSLLGMPSLQPSL